MNPKPNHQKLTCPECDSEIKSSGKQEEGSIVECEACGVECEIISTDPLTLSPLEEEK